MQERGDRRAARRQSGCVHAVCEQHSCTRVHVHTDGHTDTVQSTHPHVIYVCLCTHTCTHIIHMFIHTHTHSCPCAQTCAYILVPFLWGMGMHTHIHVLTHSHTHMPVYPVIRNVPATPTFVHTNLHILLIVLHRCVHSFSFSHTHAFIYTRIHINLPGLAGVCQG